jgi:hypothetical protein
MPALHQKPPTVVWASLPERTKTNCNTGGQNARTTSKTTDGSVGILPERTKTNCNTGGQNARTTSKTTVGSVGIPARTNKKLVVTPAGRMPALHQKPPTVVWASLPERIKTSCNTGGQNVRDT